MSEYSLLASLKDEEIPDIDNDPDAEIEEEIPAAIVCSYPGCSEELVYLGHGRRPKWCSEHKNGKATLATNLTTRSRVKGNNEQLAASASEILSKTNSLAMLAVMAFGMPLTASVIAEHNDEFKNNAYEALLLDPALCKKIMATGGKTAGLALFMAYGQLGMFVVPLAITEFKAKRDAIREEKENAAASTTGP
jgi:hypothetical protein